MDRLHPGEAEATVLGGIIHDNENIDKLSWLGPEDFSSTRHSVIYRAMSDLRSSGAPIEPLSLEHYLSKQPNFRMDGNELESVNGFSYLAQLNLRCPTKDSVQYYAGIIKQASQLRRLRRLTADVHDRIAAGVELATVQGMLQEAVTVLGRPVSATEPATLADVRLEQTAGGLPSGVGIELFVPGGIPRDKVTVLFGDTGQFKTSVKNAILFTMARSGFRCLDVSLEDSSNLTVARYLSQRTGIPYGAIAAGTVSAPALEEEDRQVLGRIVDGSRLAPRMVSLVAEAKRLAVAAVFVDYIQLLDGCSSDHTELAESMRLAQLSAARDGIAYIFVSQVKQDVRYRTLQRDNSGRSVGDPRPGIRDTLGSSAIGTHAKLGLGLFRPWAYCKAPTSESGPVGDYCKWLNNHLNMEQALVEYENCVEIIVDKNVLGAAPATVRVQVDPPTGLVTPWDLDL